MDQRPDCRNLNVANTVFCTECGQYLPESEEISTNPLETEEPGWYSGVANRSGWSGTEMLTIRLRIRASKFSRASSPSSRSPLHLSRSTISRGTRSDQGNQRRENRTGARELEVLLTKPVRLGRIDPKEGIYPDIDLSVDLAMEYGVSREHACIFRRDSGVEVEDLASTNGTVLNGTRLSPYLPVPLKDGDQLQLGKLLIEVSFGANPPRDTTTEIRVARAH
jgi:hypothetical protein